MFSSVFRSQFSIKLFITDVFTALLTFKIQQWGSKQTLNETIPSAVEVIIVSASEWHGFCLYTAPVPECFWLRATHHFICGGLAGDLVPRLQGAHSGGWWRERWEKDSWQVWTRLDKNLFFLFNRFSPLNSAYLAAVNAACERAPMIYPRAVSDGQFYSPPESVAGDCLFRSVLV